MTWGQRLLNDLWITSFSCGFMIWLLLHPFPNSCQQVFPLLVCCRLISLMGIARHRNQGRCRRHRHCGILYLSPVPDHSGTGLGPLIPVPDWFRHRNFCSFRYRTDWMPDSPTFRHLKKLLVVVVKGITSALLCGR